MEIVGSVESIRLGTTAWGGRFVAGPDARLRIRPDSDATAPANLLMKLERATCPWSLASSLAQPPDPSLDPDYPATQSDPLHASVRTLHRQHPTTGVIGIHLMQVSDEDMYPRAFALYPDTAFISVWEVLGRAFATPESCFKMYVDFMGFGLRHGGTVAPTWDEFRSGRPFVTRTFTVSLSRSNRDEPAA